MDLPWSLVKCNCAGLFASRRIERSTSALFPGWSGMGCPDCQHSQPLGDGLDDLLVNLVDSQVALDQHHPLRLTDGDLPVSLPDAAVKGILFLLKTAFVRAARFGGAPIAAARALERGLQRGQQQQRQVGQKA